MAGPAPTASSPVPSENPRVRERSDFQQRMFGLLLLNPYLFVCYFWKEELSQEPSPPQKMMFADTSRKKLACTARKVAKTVKMEAYIIQTALTKLGYATEENMIVTPRQHHMNQLRDRISSKLVTVPVFRMLKPRSNYGDGYFHFSNNCWWYMRIEGDSPTGENMAGLRARHIVVEEAAFGSHAAHYARQQTALPDCDWFVGGVPNGVRNSPFYELDQTGERDGWSIHRMTSYDNPIYKDPAQREELIRQYRGENTQDYLTQVLGGWGEEAASSFPRIGVERGIPFIYIELTDTQVDEALLGTGLSLERLLQPLQSIASLGTWAGGMDVGYSPDPSIISLFYLKNEAWRLGIRIKLLRVMGTHQALVIHEANRALGFRLQKIAVDQIGYGQAVIDALLTDPAVKRERNYQGIVLVANFGGRVECGVDDKGKILSLPTKQYSTMQLRDALARGYLLVGGEVA